MRVNTSVQLGLGTPAKECSWALCVPAKRCSWPLSVSPLREQLHSLEAREQLVPTASYAMVTWQASLGPAVLGAFCPSARVHRGWWGQFSAESLATSSYSCIALRRPWASHNFPSYGPNEYRWSVCIIKECGRGLGDTDTLCCLIKPSWVRLCSSKYVICAMYLIWILRGRCKCTNV